MPLVAQRGRHSHWPFSACHGLRSAAAPGKAARHGPTPVEGSIKSGINLNFRFGIAMAAVRWSRPRYQPTGSDRTDHPIRRLSSAYHRSCGTPTSN